MNKSNEMEVEIQALRERLSKLSAAALRISASLDLDTVLREVVASARALTGARYGGVTTIDKAGQVQDFVTSGITPDEHRQLAAWTDGMRPRVWRGTSAPYVCAQTLRAFPIPIRGIRQTQEVTGSWQVFRIIPDPDVPRELVPATLGRITWEKMLSIALDDLSTRIAPRVVVICEGSSVGTRRKDFDAEIYNRILGAHLPEIVFISGGSSQQVAATGVSVRGTLGRILPTAKIFALVDRDDKSPAEVSEWEERGDLVLSERNLESFLLGDDVIEALVLREGKDELLTDALKIKKDAISSSIDRGNPADDLKSAAGDIYTGLKQLLKIQGPGNTTDAFMRDTLAPLVAPGMPSYEKLKETVIDRIT